MNKYVVITLTICCFSFSLNAQYLLQLNEVISLAQENSIDAKLAETQKENAYWSYRTFRSEYNPRLFLSGSLPGYNRDFNENRLDNGEIAYQTREQLQSDLRLGLYQPISFTGGEISINSQVRQFQDLNNNATQWNSTLVNIELNQPLFDFNELKWNKLTEPKVYEESKRSYVEETEAISQEAVQLFFDYIDQQIGLQIAEYNLGKNDTIYRIEEGRYNIGTATEDDLLNVQLQLLTSQGQITQAELDLRQASLELRRYIGLANDTSKITLKLPEQLPEFEIDLAEALDYAKKNRADYIAFERNRIEAARDVAQAKASRFYAELTASFGLNDAASTFNETYVDPNNQQVFDVELGLPILDWGRGKSRVKQAQAIQQLTEYTIQQQLQNFEQEIITLVGRIEVLRKQIEIKKKGDEVAQKRYDVAQNRYLIGKTSITDLTLALEQKDNAKREYVNALRDFWDSYYLLRRLTLYDFAADKLLYTIDE
ncbi:MAG: TolC family protein [Cyclobacteriaceae bacterium]